MPSIMILMISILWDCRYVGNTDDADYGGVIGGADRGEKCSTIGSGFCLSYYY